jgi:hypothetical protein
MRPPVLAACLALLLLAWPAGGESLPPTSPAAAAPAPPTERVIMDVTFWALPGPAEETCLELPPGHLAIMLALEEADTPQAVSYRFSPYWYRAADERAEIRAIVTRDPRIFETTLAGGRYCYAISNEPAATPDDDGHGVELAAQAQLVAVRMTLIPD